MTKFWPGEARELVIDKLWPGEALCELIARPGEAQEVVQEGVAVKFWPGEAQEFAEAKL